MSGHTTAAAVRDEPVAVRDGRLRLHVKVAGSGSPLLYFHPLAGLDWQPFLDRLAERHTVYAPELPGTSEDDPHAIQEVDSLLDLLLAYEEALLALGIEGAAAIGQSFGGMLAAELASIFPALFRKLVLMAPIGLWRDDAPIPLVEMIAAPPEALPRYLFSDPQSPAAQAALSLPDDPELVPQAIAARVWAIGCASKFTWPLADHGLAGRLHRIAAPTLIVWGRNDALVPPVYADELASRIRGSRVALLDDCGHVPQVDQPEATQTLIADFLAS